jgi:tetrahydromethanopterin S-methyltransferase subunit F
MQISSLRNKRMRGRCGVRLTLGIVARGLLTGLGLTAAIVVLDAVTQRGDQFFGLGTGIIGVAAGGIALAVAFLMAMTSYWLASRNRMPSLRKRLLVGAIFTGAAGMASGFVSAAIWLAAGRPWFP